MNLSPREKALLKIGVFVILPLFLLQFISTQIIDRHSESQLKLDKIAKEIKEFELLGQEHQFLQRLNVKRPRVDINQIMTLITQNRNIANKPEITDLQNSNILRSTQVKFNKLRIDELTNVIYDIENHTPVILIDKLEVERSFESNKFVKASFILLTE